MHSSANESTATQEQAASAPEAVLRWLEHYIRRHRLNCGDHLPGELEIADHCGTSRSSVREALTCLKVFGIIQQRRKGGIRIVRDPAILQLRHYFTDTFESEQRHREAMEFRAAMEYGFAPLMQQRLSETAAENLHALLRHVETTPPAEVDLFEAEREFHTQLLNECGNHLGELFAHLYAPIFNTVRTDPGFLANDPDYIQDWVEQHRKLLTALESQDRHYFLALFYEHIQPYIRKSTAPEHTT